MAHRGRLNVLTSILNKPVETVLAEFSTREHQKHLDMGDVKYHLGATSYDYECVSGTGNRLNLSANPSHLEAIDPVVMGRVRAHWDQHQYQLQHQHQHQDQDQANPNSDSSSAPLGIVIHGDAAVSGQGIVSETLQLSELDDYQVGGRIHIILNNQVGFTTSSRTARSSIHCSDIFKSASSIPIIHVNGDHPRQVYWAGLMAQKYRNTFQHSVAINLVCYRRRGHNELDDPTQTLPLLYKAIQDHPNVKDLYANALLEEGTLKREEFEQLQEEERQRLNEAADHALKHPIRAMDWFSDNWQSNILAVHHSFDNAAETKRKNGISREELQDVGSILFTLPKDIAIHPDVKKLYQKRLKQVQKGKQIPWATAEALAFGSLVKQGVLFRLAGQDCQRGTFNQRHAVIVDQTTSEALLPLQNLASNTVTIANSNLSEEAALAFEYGYSLEAFPCTTTTTTQDDPSNKSLILWEAQFGDFVNGAQTILDTFISSGESKWRSKSSLVLLLPHGLEGQGPDHSSARPERFLQLCGADADYLPGDCPSHRRELEVAFDMVDKDGSGLLDREEMAEILIEMGVIEDPLQSESLFADLDQDQSGLIDRDEWIQFMCQYLRRPRNAARMVNLFICYPTTPENYFHLLRRQALDPLKPLIVFTPKSLLHHGPCSSSMDDMIDGAAFQGLLFDEDFHNKESMTSQSSLLGGEEFYQLAANKKREPQTQVKRVLMCTGKIAYDLRQKRRQLKLGADVVIVRFEQLSPFPFEQVAWMTRHYPNAEFAWVQEEPKNFGFWVYVQARILLAFDKSDELTNDSKGHGQVQQLSYIGRSTSSATASGSFHVHFREQKEIVDEAFAGLN
mmetsp:Transcript_36573/g.88632  ORF Transcript_36573/g.88632 Transcript_36573/m.88632 type:complete len:849 (+) Transcript_36573:786-3332(+)